MRKSEYQNPKSETMFKIQIFKYSKRFVFWLFEFVSNFDIRVSNFYLWILNQVQVNKKHLDTVQLQKGQALVTLLIFMIVGITVTTAAVVILLTNSAAASKIEQGTTVYYVAESAAENALLRLLRDPSYPGETLAIDTANTISTVGVNGNTYTITSNATSGNFKSSILVTATYVNNIFTISSWKEIF